MARRAKSKGINFKVIVPVVCIIIIGITFYMINDMNKKIGQKNESNMTLIENAVEDGDVENETEEELQENTTQNEVKNEVSEEVKNEVSNKVSNTSKNNTKKDTTTTTNFAPAQPAVTDAKQEAIELVKKEWGADDTVNYVFEYINENGEYVVSVKDKSTATVKYYFRVNLDTKSVELD